MASLFGLFIGLTVCLSFVKSQQDLFIARDSLPSRCYDAQGRPVRCIPEFVNAAFNVRVEATNTCGTRGPLEYCLQTGATGAKKSCEICDAAIPAQAHPPEYLTDFNNNDNQTWWQSETMYEGIQYPNHVNLTLHLGKSFDITYVRLKFHSSRPESFAIYKRTSEDGPWIPYQYYSATCRGTYGIQDNDYVTKEDETRALCTPEYSDISPLTGGNVAFSTLEGRPSAYDYEHSPVLQEWVTATDIRISLDRVNTFGDEIFGDPKVLKSYYYGVTDFAVGGRCKCNGHGSECIMSGSQQTPWETKLGCRCEHNTAGPDCNECLPFYNDQPWARASDSNAHECKACNCNGRSNRCFFDDELWQQTGHGGHCVDCIDNTDGANCERCKEDFYQREDDRCVPCNCDPTGSRSLQCNNRGQCLCKPGVEGQTCDRCAANFYDFSALGCRPCGCNVAGSIGNVPTCDPASGVCSCKENVEGQRCDQCIPGYFDLQAENEFGCLPCFCYGHSSICRSAAGYSMYSIETAFYRDAERWVTNDYNGKEVQFLFNPLTQDITVSAPSREIVYFVAPARYLGDQRSSYNQLLRFTFKVGEQGPQATLEDIVLEGAGLTISLPIFGQGNPLPTTAYQDYKFRLHENLIYGWNPRLGAQDFITIMSNLTALKIKATYTPQGTGSLSDVALETAQRLPGIDATWVEMCTCPEGYVGQYCESCAPGYRHDPPSGGQFARCVPCNCHGHAEYCDPNTGRCICQHNTAGDNCERCASGFFGNALLETPDACQSCPCPENGACVILPDEQVACLECPEGYAGHRCNLCVDGYFGEPADDHYEADCRKCDCSGNVDPNAIGNCDRTTGNCLKCVNNTVGRRCEHCLPGYYGDALKIPKGDCKACNCYDVGTLEIDPSSSLLVCEYTSGQCPCKPNVRGQLCDVCEDGFWNIASGEGCEACYCDPVGSTNHTCDIHTGQCTCRKGITGLNCNECLPYHYGFSTEGCKTCDCDPIGSLSLQCDPVGQCECRLNVEGRRCERCKENKYNKAAGCVDCPPCYNMVQDAANSHRDKMAQLVELLRAIEEDPDILEDEDFPKKLEEVQHRVDELLNDARNASAGEDGNNLNRLKELHERLLEVKAAIKIIAMKIDEANPLKDMGERNVSIAEDIIDRAKEALASAKKYLDTDGKEALQKAIERSEKFGQQSQKMSEIAREARRLADVHEDAANEIETIAFGARNLSMQAYDKARQAEEMQGDTSSKINALERNLTGVEAVLNRSKEIAKESKKEAERVYDSVLDLYSDAKDITVPETNATGMKADAEDVRKEAEGIKLRAEAIMDKQGDLVDEAEQLTEEGNNLLSAAKKQQQLTDEMLANTDASCKKANAAVEAGENTLKDAQEMLKTLRGFDELVQNSKESAKDALTKVPYIESLIQEAENKTEEAEEGIDNAKVDAEEARNKAQEAKEVAEQASKNAGDVKVEAGETKAKATQLNEQAKNLTKDVDATSDRLKIFEDQAEKDDALGQEALEKANKAKSSADTASIEVKDALSQVMEILDKLADLDEIDTSVLDALEKQIDEVQQQLNAANFEPRMVELRHSHNIQNQWMRDYAEEVKRLEEDVANIKAISHALPNECYRKAVLEP